MSTATSPVSDILQFAVIAVVLGWSVFFMLRRTLPQQIAALQQRLATVATAHGRPRLAQWLAPVTSTATGCGSGCSNCNSCGSNPATTEQPVQWKTAPSKSSGCH
jgi:hypothetical protein